MKNALLAILIAMLAVVAPASEGLREVAPDIFMHTDSCNAYVLRSGSKAILIDCGEGAIKDCLPAIGVEKVDWILHTHPHRELNQGDTLFISEGTRVAIPKFHRLRKAFENADEAWREGGSGGSRNFRPIRNIPIEREFVDGEVFQWEDFTLRVLETPGHTDYHLTYILERDGKKYAFSGDIIHSPGKVYELDAACGQYEDFCKGPDQIKRPPKYLQSIEALRDVKPDMLLPAHGEPFGDCDAGLAELSDNLQQFLKSLGGCQYFNPEPPVDLPGISLFQGGAIHYLIEDGNGRGVIIDPGFEKGLDGSFTSWVKNREGLKSIDIVMASHYHIDHMATMRAFMDHYGAKVYSHRVLGEVLAHPERFSIPCLAFWPIPIDRYFKDGESIEWSDWKFTFYHFPGQTHWHQAILAEGNGSRVLFTGDSIDDVDHVRNIDPWNYTAISDTEGAMKCVDVLEKTQPDYLATGHWRIHTWKPEYADGLRKYIKGRNAALTRLIAQEDPNFGYDMHWARLEPYRMVAQEGDVFEIEAKVRNHLSRTGKADMRLTLPEGWTCEPPVAEWDIAAKTESAFTFRVNVPAGTKPERFVIGLDAKMDAADIGEIGMAIIDIGEDHARELTDPGKYAAKDYAFF